MLSSDKLIIETPEQIPLEFRLAGVGSRFLALLIDSLIQGAAFLLVAVSVVTLFSGLLDIVRASWQWALAIVILVGSTLNYGYFVLFEAIWNGQTPGKRAMNLRVISDSGRPITAFDALTRNLLRIVDSMPTLYATGIISVLCSRQNKRLGDYVAGTVVVHEQPLAEGKPTWDTGDNAATPAFDTTRLSAEEIQLVEAYLVRRATLDPAISERTGRQIADRLAATLQVPAAEVADAGRFLENLARAQRRTAHYRGPR